MARCGALQSETEKCIEGERRGREGENKKENIHWENCSMGILSIFQNSKLQTCKIKQK